MTTHNMNLHLQPFNAIKCGAKTIEMRLFDEKRQLVNVGDCILFTCTANEETLLCRVVRMYRYPTFADMYAAWDKIALGYANDEVADPADMYRYYSPEKEMHYGVVGIQVEKID